MKATRRQRRAANRRLGRREITRRAAMVAARIVELADEGYSPFTIASSTGFSEATVRAVLDLREEEAS